MFCLVEGTVWDKGVVAQKWSTIFVRTYVFLWILNYNKLKIFLQGQEREQTIINETVISLKCEHDGQVLFLESFPIADSTKSITDVNTDLKPGKKYLVPIQYDGLYIFHIEVIAVPSDLNYRGQLLVEMMDPQGYLSATDWPLLPFYGSMCIAYLILGIIWLTVSFLQWRDLLRIQFWICAVILLGMLEKAMFYAEYQNINSNGVNKQSVVLFAEWVSCAKRTLARMLVIIVSLGFGIVK